MPANPNDACHLYWIRDETCVDPSTDGYVGLTKNVNSRWYKHRRSGNFPPSAIIVILHQGTRIERAKLERDYRPNSNMGWNRSNGGGRWRKAPNPIDKPDADDAQRLVDLIADASNSLAVDHRSERSDCRSGAIPRSFRQLAFLACLWSVDAVNADLLRADP